MSTPEPSSSADRTSAPAFQWSGWSHPGRFRKNNEDAFLCLRFDGRQVAYLGKEGQGDVAEGDCVFAVSDGMGGHGGGEFASRIAVEEIAALMPGIFRMQASGFTSSSLAFLQELFESIHAKMLYHGRAYEEVHSMGATLSLVWITPSTVWFGHIGDSRIYHLPADGSPMRQVTEDHTHVGWLRRTGKLTELQARMHPRKNEIQKVLGGSQRDAKPQLGQIDWLPGDRLLICSDGIPDAISDRVIEDVIRDPSPRLRDFPPSERVVREALDESGRDNLTALVIQRDVPAV
ncbi:MAG: PP2C family protein-serine/threonine phosphatase [Verrucomicrobiota bacterium]